MLPARNGLRLAGFAAIAFTGFFPGSALAVDTTSCASANNTVICVADLDGNGKQQVIVGHMPSYTPGIGNVPDSYLFILENNGSVRRTLCMANGAGGGAATCPAYISKGK
jgi:hypothetical protein